MQHSHSINKKSESVKRIELIEKELMNLPGGVGSPFHFWLSDVKRVLLTRAGYSAASISAELWTEWLAAKPAYLAEQAVKEAAQAAYQKARDDAARADAERARAEITPAVSKAHADQIARLQAHAFPAVELEPVNFELLHDLKKRHEQSKRDLVRAWCERFKTLPDNVRIAWQAFHTVELMAAGPDGDGAPTDDDADESDDTPATGAQWVYLNERPPGKRDIHDGNLSQVIAGFIRNPAFNEFRRVNADIHRTIKLIGNPIDRAILAPADPHRPQAAQELDDMPDNPDAVAYIVPGFMPRGWTIPHGDAGAGKSLLFHKLGLVIADKEGATFEGIEVEHGPVIFATLDPSASPDEVRPGILEIRARLGLKPSGRFHLTGAPLILNEPSSVEHWLELNRARLPCKTIMVDSLFSATSGSLALDTVAKGVRDGVVTLLRSCDAVVTPHHDNRSGDIFGSGFITAMLAAKIAIVRPRLKDGRPGGHVNVTVERLKRAPGYLKLAYTLDGPFLSLGDAADPLGADAMPVRRPDILKLLPTDWTQLGVVFKLIEHLLPGETVKARDMQWYHLRKAWSDRKLIEAKGGSIRRVGASAN